LWIDVGEDAENAPAVGWAGGEGVDVHEVIAFVIGKIAALFLVGSIAGEIVHAFGAFGIVRGRPAQAVGLWAVGDVFVDAQSALFLRAQEFPVGFGKIV